MINSSVPDDVPPIFPLLFLTIACGACSGFHGLVSSGTTSKQINNEQDVRFVGFLGTVGEGSLALAAIIACTAGFATLGDWEGYYTSFATNGIDAFVQGGGVILASIPGISESFGRTLLAVMAHPVRLSILEALCRRPRCVKDINTLVPLAQAQLSQHMAALRKADLVASHACGTLRCYYISRPTLVKRLIPLLRREHPVRQQDCDAVVRAARRPDRHFHVVAARS
jgi:carbon starvation protein CstA